MEDIVHLAHGCDIRPSLTTFAPRTDGGPPVIEYWVRPKGVAPDVLFALLCGDVSAPVTFGVNRIGMGADGSADRVSARAARRRLAAGLVHDGADRPGLVRRGPHRRRLRGPHHRAEPSAGDGAARAESNQASWQSCNACAHGQNRDHRRWKYWRGTAVRAAARRTAGQGPGGRREAPRSCEVSVRDVLGVGDLGCRRGRHRRLRDRRRQARRRGAVSSARSPTRRRRPKAIQRRTGFRVGRRGRDHRVLRERSCLPERRSSG